MKVGIVGGGITGLALAYYLKKEGIDATVFEKNKEVGGLLQTILTDGVPIEKYYHHFFNTDTDLIELLEELGIFSISKVTKTGFFSEGKTYKFDKSLDLLRFKPLKKYERILLGLNLLYLKYKKEWINLNKITAKDWILKHSTRNTYDKIWEPLLKIKFGDMHDQISAAWLWGRINSRLNSRKGSKEELMYISGSFQELIDKLASKLNIKYEEVTDVDVNTINTYVFDKVVLTVPNPIISKIYEPVKKVDYQSVVCMILELNKPLSDIYWLNVTDPSIPFGAVIEHTNLASYKEYGCHIVYLMNYVDDQNKIYKMSDQELFDYYSKGLRKIYPGFYDATVFKYHVSRDRYATPVYKTNYNPITKIKKNGKEIVVANTAAIYPYDRNVNYSIKLAKECAEYMV